MELAAPTLSKCLGAEAVAHKVHCKASGIDQAAAEVSCVAELLAAPDFTQHLLNDLHAPMVTRPRLGPAALP